MMPPIGVWLRHEEASKGPAATCETFREGAKKDAPIEPAAAETRRPERSRVAQSML